LRDALARWLDDRTGIAKVVRAVAWEQLPGGARWRSVFGPALAATFLVQAVTGLLLMTTYVPSSSQAWGSVWYIHTQMPFGWFLRGLHHWGSSAMMILLALHLLQVVLTAAYRAPREVNWWLGLGLMLCVLGLALTGYLLPWDQKGYWAAKVATNIMGSTPVVGPYVQQVVVGGSEYGNQTVTRLFGIHVGLLPISLIALLVLHLILYYRHGMVSKRAEPVEPAWPGKFARNLSFATLVLGILVFWTIREGGVGLEAPADPASTDYPARPEWYFLPLYQLLNEFKAPYEPIGTMVIPGTILGFLVLLPILDKLLPRKLVYAGASLLMVTIFGGGAFLMHKAVMADLNDPDFQAKRKAADALRERALALAGSQGVPPDGALYLMRRDPATEGRLVLRDKCLGCHVFGGQGAVTTTTFNLTPAELASATPAELPGDVPEAVRRAVASKRPGFAPAGPGTSEEGPSPVHRFVAAPDDHGEVETLTVSADGLRIVSDVAAPQRASDLQGFGSRDWARGLLENPEDAKYFGKAAGCGGMKSWKEKSKLTPAELDEIADFLANVVAKVPEDLPASEWAEREDVQAHPAMKHFQGEGECAKCHTDWVYANEEAPNLYGWGSDWWTRRMIRRPSAPHLYGYLDAEHQMPGFPGSITEEDLRVLVRYIRGDYRDPEPVDTLDSGHGVAR
jgi:quinol-cytochrome oxidoreductase complex cytochrome b subunit/mono/diheme cytochrome c family protein